MCWPITARWTLPNGRGSAGLYHICETALGAALFSRQSIEKKGPLAPKTSYGRDCRFFFRDLNGTGFRNGFRALSLPRKDGQKDGQRKQQRVASQR